MNNKLSVAVALVAGLAGGMLTRYIAPPPVFAQVQVPVVPGTPPPVAQIAAAKEIRAQSFVLVGPNDNVTGTFTTEPWRGTTRIVLRDAYGREIWSAGGGLMRPLAANAK